MQTSNATYGINDEVYVTETPYGEVDAVFVEDEYGVELHGPQYAVEHIIHTMSISRNSNGMTMTPQSVEPHDYFYFCQPEGSDITIHMPPAVQGNSTDSDTNIDPIMGNELNTETGAGMQYSLDGAIMNPMERMKLSIELSGVQESIDSLEDSPASIMQKFKLSMRMNQITDALDGISSINPVEQEEQNTDEEDDGGNDEFGVKKEYRKNIIKTRERINSQVVDIVTQIRMGAKDIKTLTPEEIALMKQYSGKGGLTENSQYEYYTPQPVAEGAWDILKANGYANGNVLEPSTGAGVFSATKPQGSIITGTEIDPIAATVNKALHPEDAIMNQSFEKLAVSAPDNFFDAVVGNVPFGDARGPSAADDPDYKNEKRIERYFINRVIDKTRPGGLITLVVPTGVVSNAASAWKTFRAEISRKAEFLGAHKLPSKTFASQGTDVVTDIIVLRKHPSDLLDKVNSLPSETLASANVLWDEFISGKYWLGEGRKFIHGTYVPPDVTKVRSSEQVIPENGLTPEALKQKLAVKFDSRIDWAAIDSAAPVIVYYAKGDRRVVNGKEYEFDGSKWAEVTYNENNGEIDPTRFGAKTIDELRQMVSSPSSMLAISAEQAFNISRHYPNILETHQKMAVDFSQSQPLDAFREQAYRGSLIGSMVTQYIAKANNGDADERDRLAIKALLENEVRLYGHPKSLKGFYLEGEMARYFGSYVTSIDEKGNVSDVISNGVTKSAGFDATNAQSVAEYLIRKSPFGSISLDEFKAQYLGARDIKELGDIADIDGIAFTANGEISTTSKYCCGEVYVKSAQIMGLMETEKDPRVLQKLQSQIDLMMRKVKVTEIQDISFGLRDKWVPAKYKHEFLTTQRYTFHYLVDTLKTSDTGVEFMGAANNPDSTDPNGQWVDKKTGKQDDFTRQLEHYMNGKSIGYNVKEKQGETASERIEAYRSQVTSLEDQFSSFMQSHANFVEIQNLYNTTFNNFVKPEYDRESLALEGVSANVQPHWYQNQAVRQLSEEGSGILGHDVGLGKTYSAIAFSKYDRQMGRSKKHCIVVPNAVLGNWYMESKKMLGNHSDVTFVGFHPKLNKDGSIKTEPVLDENGNPKKNKHTGEIEYQDVLEEDANVDLYEKMHLIPQSNVGLVVMTFEKFALIPMREENRMRYAEKWVQKNMMSNADMKKIGQSYQDAKGNDKLRGEMSSGGTKKKSEIPYLEDMGFDRILVDEAHAMKNSFAMGGDTQKLAYLPNPMSSQRGRDMAMKMSWMREKYDGKGAILLTATPVANSPIEIFNMLSLVIDEREFERVGVYTPDDFVRQFGIIDMVDKIRVSGEMVNTEGLKGFKNLNALRTLFHRFSNMKNATDVDPDGNVLKLPDGIEIMSNVTMTDEQIELYKILREEAKLSGNPENIKSGLARPMFAVIRDMDRVTTDIDMYNRTVTYLFKPEDIEKVRGMVTSLPEFLTFDVEDEETGEKDTVKVAKATEIDVGTDNVTYVSPDLFDSAINDAIVQFGIDYVSHPITPKYAKLITNMRAELDATGKQIVFTEEKSQHGKLLRIIQNNLPLDERKIAIINADTASGKNLQKISDAYNRGDVVVIVANKKAEVGVNLQLGTSAIHHMTLPWNPASIQQRNGRGVRQGNTKSTVQIYYYQAKGSFDEYRLDLLKNKANWITALMDKNSTEDTSDNAAAMGALDQAALLSDNREEFLAKMAEQKAKKSAEAKERSNNAVRVKFNQLIIATNALKSFDEDYAFAVKRAADEIEQAKESLAKEEAKGEAADKLVITRRKSHVESAIAKQGKVTPAWDKKKAELETSIKQNSSYLRTVGAKGELPFDVSIIDDPSNSIMNSKKKIITVGKQYKVGRRIYKINSLDSGKRIAKALELFTGRVYNELYVDNNFEDCVEVNYSQEDLNLIRLFESTYSYSQLKNIQKDVYLANLDKLEIDRRSNFLYRDEEGNLRYDSRSELTLSAIVYPDPKDRALQKEIAEIYKASLDPSRKDRSQEERSIAEIAANIYGGNGWKDILYQHLTVMSQEEITAKASEILNRKVGEMPAITTSNEYAYRASNLIGSGYYPSEITSSSQKELAEFISAGGFINMSDANNAIFEAGRLIVAALRKKADELVFEEKIAKERDLMSDPNYKMVPADVQEKFSQLDIDICYNTIEVVDGSKTFKPFSMVWLKSRVSNGGVLKERKERIKGRFGALWFKSYTSAYEKYTMSWRFDSKTDLMEIYYQLS